MGQYGRPHIATTGLLVNSSDYERTVFMPLQPIGDYWLKIGLGTRRQWPRPRRNVDTCTVDFVETEITTMCELYICQVNGVKLA